MNILYGIAGEGLGHSSRAKAVIHHLKRKGHKVKVITYGQAHEALSKDHDTEKIHGIHLLYKNHKMDLIKTIAYNLAHFPRNIFNINRFRRIIKEFKPDVCITDMEPITALISYYYGIPLICMDNQHAMTNSKLYLPEKYKHSLLIGKHAIHQTVRKADAFIIFSFSKLKPIRRNTYFVSPLLRKEILQLKPYYGDKILVYLSKKTKEILDVLKKSNEKFIVYGFHTKKKEDNIEYKELGPHFVKDLESCKAVIATSGFSLLSEAMYLKKPFLSLPLHRQPEQLFNALALKEVGYGGFTEHFTKKDLDSFLKRLNHYKDNLKKHKSDPSEAFRVLDKLLKKLSA